jgi:hypothetical protein
MSRSAKLLVAAGAALCLVGLLVVAIVGCGGGGGPAPQNGGGGTGTLMGTVSVGGVGPAAAGAALGGVTVEFVPSAPAGSRGTGPDGRFAMAGAPAGPGLVRFSKPGYVPNFRAVTVPTGGSASVQVALSPVGNTVAIDPALTQTAADHRGDGLNAQIVFEPNSLPPTATTVEITTSVQGDPNYDATFPGQFVGVPTGGTPGPLESFGIAAITVRDAAGDKLQLDPALPAHLTIPVSPGNDPGTPTIPLWRLNETTGIWEQVGTATRQVGPPVVYTADVDHLSSFNLDLCSAGAELKIIVVDYTAHPEYATIDFPNGALDVATLDALPRVAGAWVKVVGSVWAGLGCTDQNGVLVLAAPEGTRVVTFTVEKAGYKEPRTFYFSGWGSSPMVVYMGLQKDATWVPPVTGDVGTIIR